MPPHTPTTIVPVLPMSYLPEWKDAMNPLTDSNNIVHHDLRDGQVSPSVAASRGAEDSHRAHTDNHRPTPVAPGKPCARCGGDGRELSKVHLRDTPCWACGGVGGTWNTALSPARATAE